MFKKSYLLVLLAVVILLGGATLVVFAQAGWPTSSEIDGERMEAVIQENFLVMGDDPDEDGYQGEVLMGIEQDIPASGEIDLGAGPMPNWEELLEGEPDQNTGIDDEVREGETRWSGFHYIFVPGSVLIPRDSKTPWYSDGSGGCVSVNTYATEILNVDLNLPQGSRIDYLRLYYYDTSAQTSYGWVTTYNGAGGLNDRVSVTSVGTAGYGTNLSAYLGHIVDNASNAYVLNYRPNQTGSTMRLCGLRVAYRLP